jgi:Domain of unknown function (DUF3806)
MNFFSPGAVSRFLVLATMCVGFSLAVGQEASEPKFTELSAKDREQLDRQRAIIAGAVRERYGSTLTRTNRDLPTLQRLIDDSVFNKSQTYELQSLGVAFGDVLTSALPLRWVMITDEYGTDPTLRYKQTALNVNALTMISKRIESGKRVDLSRLYQNTRDQLADSDKSSR